MAIGIDALRVATDARYAASLSSSDWASLALDPTWMQMVAEQYELVSASLAANANKIGGTLQVAPPAPNAPKPHELSGKDLSVIGQRVPRVQGFGIVTGLGQYTEHLTMPGMLHTRTLRSPYPHAKVVSINTKKAEELPGVHLVLHQDNLPEEYKDAKLGSGPPDRMIFGKEIFEVGHPIAVVAAESEHIAEEATRLIEVQYEVLPATVDMMEAIKSSTQKQWDNKLEGLTLGITPPLVRGTPDGASAEVMIEGVPTRATEQHLALELTGSLSYWDNDKLVMYYTNQWAHGTRSGLSQVLKIPQNKIRVVQPGYMGSGYGYRSGIDLPEIHAAIVARMTGRPVKNLYTRYEDFVTRTHRPEFRNEMKLGVTRDGTMQFLQAKVIANVGAQRGAAANGAWYQMQILYKIPNVKLEAVDAFTNGYKSGPYRCVSHPNGTFAMEVMVEKAAYQIGMDPVEFRLKNLNEQGNPDTNKPFSNPGIRDCITQAADRIGWKQKWHAPKAKEVRPGVFHGIALAAHACSHGGGGNPATGQVIVNTDGTIQCVSGSTDVGSSQRTTMAMIAAESVGVPLAATSISFYVDTELSTDTSGTFGSQQTNNGGRGMYEAGQDARRQILEAGALKFVDDAKKKNETIQVKAQDLDIKNGEVLLIADPKNKLKLADVMSFHGGSIVGKSTYRQAATWERAAWAAHAAEVEVDTLTGTVKVVSYVAAHDVGRALNPFSLEQQIEGGVVMALGAALTEEMLLDKATGLPLNPNMLDYKPLSIKDAPNNIEVILVERPKEYGVYGAHGIGEPPMGPPGPVIANAIYNAVGVWMMSMPVTREKLLAALRGA